MKYTEKDIKVGDGIHVNETTFRGVYEVNAIKDYDNGDYGVQVIMHHLKKGHAPQNGNYSLNGLVNALNTVPYSYRLIKNFKTKLYEIY